MLDFGCGTGHMGPLLSQYGALVGVEGSADAVAFGAFADYTQVCQADALHSPSFPGGQFDLIALLDVLEHVDDDLALLSGLARLLPSAGSILVSVPMDPKLFCLVDEQAGHVRRYTRASLEDLAYQAGLEIVAATGYVVTLLPLARWQRHRVAAGVASPMDEMQVPVAPVNTALSLVVKAEGLAARWVELPEGLSVICVMRSRTTHPGGLQT